MTLRESPSPTSLASKHLRIFVVLSVIVSLSGCVFLGWLVRGGAGRAAITRAAATESVASTTVARSAFAGVAVRSGLSVTEALAMRGVTSGLARSFPVRLGSAEVLPLEIYEGGKLALKGELRRSGTQVTLTDGAGGTINARYTSNTVMEVRRGSDVIGRGTEANNQVRLTARDGQSLGQDVVTNSGRTIRHLDHRGVVIAETSIESTEPSAARRLTLRVTRELAEDIRRDLENEAGYADTQPPAQQATALQLEPISLTRRANFGLLQTNIDWTATFLLRNTSNQAIGINLLNAVTAPFDCHSTNGMRLSRVSGMNSSVNTNWPGSALTTIAQGATLQVIAVISCDSFNSTLVQVASSPLTLELLVQEKGLVRTIAMGGVISVQQIGVPVVNGPKQIAGPFEITPIYATRRSSRGLLRSSISWHVTLGLRNTSTETLFVGHDLIDSLEIDPLNCSGEPTLDDAWGIARHTDFSPRPTDETRQRMLSIAPNATAQIALEFECTTRVERWSPQAFTAVSGNLLIERGSRFEKQRIWIDQIPLGVGRN